MGRSSGDEIVLSYNDAVLRRSDLDILSGPYFLNDRIIEFYFSYLSSTYRSDDILLVPPSIAFWLQNYPDEESFKAFIEPLSLSTKNMIYFPVNNNEDFTLAEGGSHWSLLVFYREANVFVHHDSFQGSNCSYAKRLYKSVALFVASPDSETRYLEQECSPQQQNGYDCGLFVIAIARVLCSWYMGGGSVDSDDLWFSVVKEQVTPSAVLKMRSEILDLIKGLMTGK
uniref:Ubiquitin-like protease family profile domain-containing protein n=1 Tax=Opuntia streptacantha TaxID=393608 RepID=A0A7C8Z2M2_OPUST